MGVHLLRPYCKWGIKERGGQEHTRPLNKRKLCYRDWAQLRRKTLPLGKGRGALRAPVGNIQNMTLKKQSLSGPMIN